MTYLQNVHNVRNISLSGLCEFLVTWRGSGLQIKDIHRALGAFAPKIKIAFFSKIFKLEGQLFLGGSQQRDQQHWREH